MIEETQDGSDSRDVLEQTATQGPWASPLTVTQERRARLDHEEILARSASKVPRDSLELPDEKEIAVHRENQVTNISCNNIVFI